MTCTPEIFEALVWAGCLLLACCVGLAIELHRERKQRRASDYDIAVAAAACRAVAELDRRVNERAAAYRGMK